MIFFFSQCDLQCLESWKETNEYHELKNSVKELSLKSICDDAPVTDNFVDSPPVTITTPKTADAAATAPIVSKELIKDAEVAEKAEIIKIQNILNFQNRIEIKLDGYNFVVIIKKKICRKIPQQARCVNGLYIKLGNKCSGNNCKNLPYIGLNKKSRAFCLCCYILTDKNVKKNLRTMRRKRIVINGAITSLY